MYLKPGLTNEHKSSKGFTCPTGQSSSKMTIGAGESLTYSTQEGARYTSGVDCTVEFKKGAFCNKLRFSCEDFSLGRGDKMFVTKGEKTLRLALFIVLDDIKNFEIIIHLIVGSKRKGSGPKCIKEDLK